MKHQSPYEVFDLWEGCGRDEVRKRFYELVKSEHPDRYGGNVTDSIRKNAQEIFLIVKDSYNKLLMAEGAQTVPKRPASSLDESSDARREIMARLDERVREAGLQEPSEVAMPNRLDITTQPEGLDESSEVRQLLASRLAKRAAMTQQLQSRQMPPQIGRSVVPSRPAPPPAMDEEERRAKLAQLTKKKNTLFETNPGLKKGEPIPGLGVTPVPSEVLTRTSPGIKDELSAKDYFNRGFQEFKLQRYDSALGSLTKARDMEPTDGLYLTFYAYCTFMADPSKRDEAEKLLREAVKLNHRQAAPDAYLFLGYVLKAKNAINEANQCFERALALNPASHEAEREIRLYKMRKQADAEKPASVTEGVGIFKKLFKK
jgi:tetratricopeptide (TPR) repeat protein